MTNVGLFDLLGQIDSKFYDEVLGGDPEKPIKISTAGKSFSVKRLILPIAVCLVLAIGAVFTVNYLKAPVYTVDISLEAKKLYLDEYPELKQYENSGLAVRSRVMDINCDGVDEIFVVTGTGEAPPQIYSETESGIEKTGELEMTTFGTKLTDPEQLFYYDNDGQRYWYYSYICYNGEEGDVNDILVHAAARINYDGVNYFTDFPLGYGSLDAEGAGKKYAKDLQFSLSDGIPFRGYVTEKRFNEISADEFRILWEKHTYLPDIITDFYDEYPALPLSEEDIPYSDAPFDDAIPKARISALPYGEYDIWLLGENVHRRENQFNGIFFTTAMDVALVKDRKIVSKESVVLDNDYTSVKDGKYIQFIIGNGSYFCLYDLKDTAIIAYVDKYGFESNFFAVKDGRIILLRGTINSDSGEIGHNVHASIGLQVLGNTLIDSNNGMIYSFNPEAFDKDPNIAPHFTTRKTEADDFGIDKYVHYAPNFEEMVPYALITEKQCGDYTVKLLGDNVQNIYYGDPHTAYTKLYIAVETDSGEVFGTEIANISEYLNPDKLNDQIFTFEMKDGIGVGVYTSYYRAYVRLYSIKDGKVTCLIDPDNYDPQYMVSDIALSGGYYIDAQNNAFVLNRGGSIGLNFQSNEISNTAAASAVKGGMFLVTGTGPSLEIVDRVCGTEAEWTRFMNVLHSGEIARIDMDLWYTEFASRLPDTAAARILELLSNAQMKLFEEMDNPTTGGLDRIYAYDENGVLLLNVGYDGYWLSVCFPGDTKIYTFDGENCGLDELNSLLVGFGELSPSFY